MVMPVIDDRIRPTSSLNRNFGAKEVEEKISDKGGGVSLLLIKAYGMPGT